MKIFAGGQRHFEKVEVRVFLIKFNSLFPKLNVPVCTRLAIAAHFFTVHGD